MIRRKVSNERPYAHDYNGKKIGYLNVLRLADKKSDRSGRYWICKCVCGSEKEIVTAKLSEALKMGYQISCGCQKVERMRKLAKGKPITNPYRDPENPAFYSFITWQRMIRKCYNVGDSSYEIHGGVGRKVYAPWKSNFENFYRDLGPRTPEQHLILLNKDKDFEPGNVKWGTLKEERELLKKWRRERENNSRNRIELADTTRLSGECEALQRLRCGRSQIPVV